MTETNQTRSPRVQAIIDSKLSSYFSNEQLQNLSDAEVDILNDYFSNNQLRELKNAPEQIIKSLVSRHVKTVERQRLTNIPVDELPQMLEYYKDIADEVEEVVCTNCKNTIAVEIKHSQYDSTQYFNNPNLHWQGRFVVAVGNFLHGYRKRHDDVMGYRCGAFIENPEYKPAMEKYLKDLKKYEDQVAKYQEAEAKGKPIKEAPKLRQPKLPTVQPEIPCHNESTMSPVEIEAVPDEHLAQSVITQADIQKIKQHINKVNWKKPVKKVKDGYLLDDKFLLRKVQ